jgi:phosphoserine phosphatase
VSKLAAFDMDGVLVDIVSSWVHVHRQFGVNNDHSLFAYLRGEIDDREFIRRDIALWKEADPDVTSAKIRSMLATAPIMTGAAELMAELKRRGFSTNGLLTDASDRLTGEGVFRVRLMDKGSKVSEAARELGVRHEDIVSVGNSRYDVSMFEHSAFGIAFCPEDDHVKEKADAVVVEKDLRKVLEHLDGF